MVILVDKRVAWLKLGDITWSMNDRMGFVIYGTSDLYFNIMATRKLETNLHSLPLIDLESGYNLFSCFIEK